jgi:hypothetical protein
MDQKMCAIDEYIAEHREKLHTLFAVRYYVTRVDSTGMNHREYLASYVGQKAQLGPRELCRLAMYRGAIKLQFICRNYDGHVLTILPGLDLSG